jgi:hypothetical protein
MKVYAVKYFLSACHRVFTEHCKGIYKTTCKHGAPQHRSAYCAVLIEIQRQRIDFEPTYTARTVFETPLGVAFQG